MFPCAWFGYGFGLWWIFPLIMIMMILFCFFMMRRCTMSHWMGCCGRDNQSFHDEDEPSVTMAPPKESMKENL